ncbi:ATP-dependent DNA ligase [Microlunatus parietis]|uniref:DNA ligase (ATP) n=1 Tax=Microlunatus parietis TaxID=682979 RepID=A0A7Y9I3C8_9ACTN|nr:ATP-dependent DNA ligase [Microlunatus parietis]NYE69184.1 bifunctional non-homologous end joining protein LigD [Microlunatus parietis]
MVVIDGHQVRLTNLDKVLYPETGTTKGEVLLYYTEIADRILPQLASRPATRKRWPNGVGTERDPEIVFFTKNLDSGTPDWITRQGITHSDGVNNYPIIDSLASLTQMAQYAALELHVPQWRFDDKGKPGHPDRLVLDLDPGPGVGLAECAEVARQLRDLLAGIGLTAVPVTSGSKGMHLYATLAGDVTSDGASTLARELARALESTNPDLVTSQMKKSLRPGKVFVDWSQNNAAKTTICPYSLRGRPRPMVAAPRTWAELDDPDLDHLDYHQVLARLDQPDPLTELVPPEERKDRLSTYRSMRDAAKTPEPVPSTPPVESGGRSFVIQEHHARRLHWDFRLERDGVLVSWALPKGVPTNPDTNHLAVQTEDHPLEYGSFEGSIPAGEYGGGEVTIWDSGSYVEHKWRDGKEVIATLTGRDGGGLDSPRTYALIHTGGGDRPDNQWLIHLMKPESAAKLQDQPPEATGPLPEPVTPMTAGLAAVGDFGNADDWAFEMKWDGVRVIACLGGGQVKLYSRRGLEVTATYPEIAEACAKLDTDQTILDGEIVALDADGRPSFSRLQHRINVSKPADVARLRSSVPVQLVAFDLIMVDDRSLLRTPYTERREQLTELLTGADPRIQVPPAFDGDLETALEVSEAMGLEGVVAKRRTSTYLKGRRASTWLKIKHRRHQEVIVVGWREGQGRRGGSIGALVLAVPDGGGLRYVGAAGSGLGDADLDLAMELLTPLELAKTPLPAVPAEEPRSVHWVEPVLVGEVEYAGWTEPGLLWHPVWRGWRPDKTPDDVVVEGKT